MIKVMVAASHRPTVMLCAVEQVRQNVRYEYSVVVRGQSCYGRDLTDPLTSAHDGFVLC